LTIHGLLVVMRKKIGQLHPRGTIQKLTTSSKFIHSVALVAEARATRRASHERFEKKKKFDTSNYIHNWYKQKDLLFVYKLVFTFLNTCF
jgi:hypothetical protein